MAQIMIKELYHSEKYNIMGNAVAELMAEGKEENDVRTALELLIVKRTLLAAKQAQNNGDTIQF